MKKHLLLEGAIQEGKSTLIRKLLSIDLAQFGGFSSQRLLNSFGETVGFRIVPASEAMELTREYSPELPDIFLHFNGEEIENKPEVFIEAGVRYLREKECKKIILIDEIGGMELLVPEFRQELYKTLEGNIPCIGVLKQEAGYKHLCRNTHKLDKCSNYNLQLRNDLINRFNAEIIRFRRAEPTPAEKAVKTFFYNINK